MRLLVIVLASILMMAGQAMARDGTLATIKKNWHPSLPSPLYFTSITIIPSYVFGVPWCFATATMIATVVLHRKLKTSEAWQIFGSCVVPFLGGLAFKNHPEWDIPQPATNVDRFGIGGQ